jgi:NAD(P)-dependent dehydrogenase (short-subunit alcohol dehydrogenase family)
LGGRIALHLDDVTDPASPARIVPSCLEAFGRIDALVNNAAIVPRSTRATTTTERFDRTMAINVHAPLLPSQAAFPALKAARGCVLNIGSTNVHSGEATPSGRLIQPEEIAAASIYRLSDEARPISGSVLELE